MWSSRKLHEALPWENSSAARVTLPLWTVIRPSIPRHSAIIRAPSYGINSKNSWKHRAIVFLYLASYNLMPHHRLPSCYTASMATGVIWLCFFHLEGIERSKEGARGEAEGVATVRVRGEQCHLELFDVNLARPIVVAHAEVSQGLLCH